MLEKRNFAIVKDVMSIPIISIKKNETAQDAIHKLKNKGVHKAVISDNQGKVIGCTDIWKLGLLKHEMKIEEAFNNKTLIYSEVSSVNQDKPLKEVIPELLKKGILVVIDDKSNEIGVIAPQDIRKLKTMKLRI